MKFTTIGSHFITFSMERTSLSLLLCFFFLSNLQLTFVSRKSGMQTWEYAPQYALRTYAYILPMELLAKSYQHLYQLLSPYTRGYILSFLIDSDDTTSVPVEMWTVSCLRATLAGITACCEVTFLAALERYSKALALATGLILLTSTGMAHAAGAYLPSSTIMCFWLVCAAAYLRGNNRAFIGTAVVATLSVGWPFGVIVFVPMGLHILIRSTTTTTQVMKILSWTALWTVAVQATVMLIDYHHYEKQWLSPTLNILVYNAKEGGDELYGVEPASYYIKNLLLNFSYTALLGLISLPVASIMRFVGKPWQVPLVVSCVGPLYLWLSTVLRRPHKEERFLFVIYPALAACTAMTCEQIWILTAGRLMKKKEKFQSFWILLLVPACLMCISRTMALSKYYTAPLSVYSALAQHQVQQQAEEGSLVCTCGEWHRFPSSFYLPSEHQLGFLPSSFTGQLPKTFGSSGIFNDKNKQEMDRYVSTAEECAFIVELDQGDDPECLRYINQQRQSWSKIAQVAYLDAAKTSTLHRIFYLPGLHEKATSSGAVRYNDYVVYQQVKPVPQ
jgi:alpha-1,2-mannosyltransferase